MMDKDTLVRHHLLEIILWPNKDGSFTEIRNTVEDLQSLGIYDDYKLVINISVSEHAKLHLLGHDRIGKVNNTCFKKGHIPVNKGISCTDEVKKHISDGVKIGMRKTWNKFIENNRIAVAKGADRRTWLSIRYQEMKSENPTICWNDVQKQLNNEWKEVNHHEARHI